MHYQDAYPTCYEAHVIIIVSIMIAAICYSMCMFISYRAVRAYCPFMILFHHAFGYTFYFRVAYHIPCISWGHTLPCHSSVIYWLQL